MKLMVLDAGHCLNLSLARLVHRRSDTELVIEPGLGVDAQRLREEMPAAVIVPPLAAPMEIEPAAVVAHGEGVDACLKACRETDTPLVWCVSDQLYQDGFDIPIDEDVIPAPRDESLRRLIAVGDHIRESHPRHLIVRLGPLFALEGSHAWLGNLIDRLVAGEEVRAAQDIIFCPTSADAVAMALVGMLQQLQCGSEAWGAYHLAGTEPVSAFTFTSMVRTQLAIRLEGAGEQVTLGKVKPLKHHHDQPLRRVLNCRRVLGAFGVHQKPWRLEMERLLDEWCMARGAVEEEGDPSSC
ncbi:MAG: sugar nucleotide-binding protein [Halomonadaceae bacterium]|nr:sugar nucleotide-binding protein [Halomonadaceae bacterium]